MIRPATITDAERIATINVKTWQCAYNGHIPDSYLDKLSIEEKTLSWQKGFYNPLPGAETFVLEQSNLVIGWCTIGKSRDKDLPEFGEIFGIYVDSNYLGQGFGTKLIEFASDFLKKQGYQKALLWVLTSNGNARKFYEKNGWQVEGKTKIDHYDNLELHETRYIITLK